MESGEDNLMNILNMFCENVQKKVSAFYEETSDWANEIQSEADLLVEKFKEDKLKLENFMLQVENLNREVEKAGDSTRSRRGAGETEGARNPGKAHDKEWSIPRDQGQEEEKKEQEGDDIILPRENPKNEHDDVEATKARYDSATSGGPKRPSDIQDIQQRKAKRTNGDSNSSSNPSISPTVSRYLEYGNSRRK